MGTIGEGMSLRRVNRSITGKGDLDDDAGGLVVVVDLIFFFLRKRVCGLDRKGEKEETEVDSSNP